MGKSKFSPVPDVLEPEQAVVWEKQALREWLQGLSAGEVGKSCAKLCSVLQQLSRAEIATDKRIELLEEIGSYVKLFESRVEAIYLDSHFPLPDEQFRCLEWLVWCYICLARCFNQIAEQANGREQKAELLYQALNALVRSYLPVKAVYSEPEGGFWLMCYRIYRIAEQEGLLPIPLRDGMASGSIDQIFKRLLVFNLCDLNQFRPREMQKIFDYLDQFAARLPISENVRKDRVKGLFVFNLDEDQEPVNLLKCPGLQQNTATRYIAPVGLAKVIYQSLQQGQGNAGQLQSVNKAMLMRVIKTLGQTHARQFKRIEEQGRSNGLIGFENIRDYLHHERPAERPQISTVPKSARPYNYDTDQFEVVAEGDELVYQMSNDLKKRFANDEKINKILTASGDLSDKVDIWGGSEQEKTDIDVKVNDFAIMNSSAKGYGIAVNSQLARVKVGDLFAIVSDKSTHRVELAVIRRIRRLSKEQLYLGIELIGIAEETVLMRGAEQESKKQTRAIFLPSLQALKRPDCLIFNSAQFNVGEFVNIDKAGRKVACRISKLINSTPSFSHVEIFYPKVTE